MFRLTAVLLGMLAATAAYSHEEIELPELPIPEIDQLFPVDDKVAAYRWAGFSKARRPGDATNSWGILVLSESSLDEIAALVAAIQQPILNGTCARGNKWDDRENERVALWLQADFGGGVSGEWFSINLNWGTEGREGDISPFTLKSRYVPVEWRVEDDTTLRESGMSIRLRFQVHDWAVCAGNHTSHSHNTPRHTLQAHHFTYNSEYSFPDNRQILGPWTGWIPIANLLDGNVAAAPEQPADNEDATSNDDAPEDDASNEDALAQLRAELDALRGDNDALRGDNNALRGDLAAVRDSVAWLSDIDLDGLGSDTIIRVDTVEVARVDTLHFCPPSDQDRQDLFDLFTGVNEDTTNAGGAGKAAAVRPSSWGQIKALVQGE